LRTKSGFGLIALRLHERTQHIHIFAAACFGDPIKNEIGSCLFGWFLTRLHQQLYGGKIIRIAAVNKLIDCNF